MLALTVNDRCLLESGTRLMSGIQALVRLPMLRRELNREVGLDTAEFISGYRGSPNCILDDRRRSKLEF